MSRQHHVLIAAVAVILNISCCCSAFFVSVAATAARPATRPAVPARTVKIGDRWRGCYSSRSHRQAHGGACTWPELTAVVAAVPSPGVIDCYQTPNLGATNGTGSSTPASPRNGSDNGSDDDGGIDLNSAMANARANLAEGTSPGAGLESAFDQADAAFADLIVTSIDSQGIGLDDEDVEELAKGGSMDGTSTSKKSKGLFGDMSDVFGALSGGAHIVKREDGTV